MGRMIDTNDIRVKPQYMQDIMGIAMIRCEDLARILADAPTVEAIPKADYEARLKAEREKIAENVANKMSYMGTCLNERNIILGIITGKRETLDSLCSICKSESCVSKGTAIPKADYEARLKADMVAMLKDLRLEIEKIFDNRPLPCSHYQRTLFYGEVDDLILDKINALKGEKQE